mmetsp:Transcript_118220/g.280671  ORF Transcript_118220/g.280671 Transcript_118220/m.280671 type:complete len:239 (-) Transcript_118220:464-1180(-)
MELRLASPPSESPALGPRAEAPRSWLLAPPGSAPGWWSAGPHAGFPSTAPRALRNAWQETVFAPSPPRGRSPAAEPGSPPPAAPVGLPQEPPPPESSPRPPTSPPAGAFLGIAPSAPASGAPRTALRGPPPLSLGPARQAPQWCCQRPRPEEPPRLSRLAVTQASRVSPLETASLNPRAAWWLQSRRPPRFPSPGALLAGGAWPPKRDKRWPAVRVQTPPSPPAPSSWSTRPRTPARA